MVSAKAASTIALSVLTTSAAVLAVFVTVGIPVEKSVVKKQTAFVIQNLLQDTDVLGDAKAPLRAYIDNLQPPDLQAEDAQAAASNTELITKAALLVAGALVCGLAAVTMVARSQGFAAGPVIRQSLTAAMLAAGTEIAFLLLVAQHFISADPQAVRLMILQALARDSA